MKRIGTAPTVGVTGLYWMSSSTSVRSTTAPGDVATVSPRRNGRRSTVFGMPPLWRTSSASARAPLAMLAPFVSTAFRIAAGLPSRLLVGASASTTWPTTNRARPSLLSSRPSRPTVSSATAVAPRYPWSTRR